MNKLNFIQDGIISSKKDLEEFKNKKTAKIILISDSHGYYNIVEKIFFAYGDKIDAIFFLGDGIDDFLKLFNLLKDDKILQEFLPPVICLVSGNCDCEKEQLKRFNFPNIIQIKTCNTNIILTHGHEFFVDFELNTLAQFTQINDSKIAIYGHTHIPKKTEIDNITLINPGSISKPRGGSENSFALLSLNKNKKIILEFINPLALP